MAVPANTAAIPAAVGAVGSGSKPASQPKSDANTGSINIATETTVGARYLRLAKYPAVPTMVPHRVMNSCDAICRRVSHPNAPTTGSNGRVNDMPSKTAPPTKTIGRFSAICAKSAWLSSTLSRTLFASRRNAAPVAAPATTTTSPTSVGDRRFRSRVRSDPSSSTPVSANLRRRSESHITVAAPTSATATPTR